MRRRLLCALFSLALALPALARAQDPSARDKVTFRLNWLAYGFHAPFYYGVSAGIYRNHGIDLTIGEGQGSGRAVQAVAAGSDMFGLADGTAIVNGAIHGAPVQAVMGIMNRSPNGVIIRADSGITSLAGLKGQTIAASTGEVGLVVFPAVLRAQHLPDDYIRVLRVDGATKIVAVLEKRVAGLLGGVENQALILKQRGTPVTTILYSDLGVNSIGLAIVTTTGLEQKNPDLVKRFIVATQESYERAAQHPDEAVKALLAAVPTLPADLSLEQLQTGLPLMRSPHGTDKQIGWMAPEDWDETVALMKEYQGLETDRVPASFWTDSFLPKPQ